MGSVVVIGFFLLFVAFFAGVGVGDGISNRKKNNNKDVKKAKSSVFEVERSLNRYAGQLDIVGDQMTSEIRDIINSYWKDSSR